MTNKNFLVKTKFGELKPGDMFSSEDDHEIYMKVYGHNLPATTAEGESGYAVLMNEGLLCVFGDHENVEFFDLKILEAAIPLDDEMLFHVDDVLKHFDEEVEEAEDDESVDENGDPKKWTIH